jgi:hypothetical protein
VQRAAGDAEFVSNAWGKGSGQCARWRGTAQAEAGETAEPSSASGDEARIPSGRVR